MLPCSGLRHLGRGSGDDGVEDLTVWLPVAADQRAVSGHAGGQGRFGGRQKEHPHIGHEPLGKSRAIKGGQVPPDGHRIAVLGLDDDQVEIACRRADDDAWVANFNAPGQVVIAGHVAAVEAAIEACKAAGAKRALPLPVSVPSHCSLMRGAAEQLSDVLASVEIRQPAIPVVNNVDVAHPYDPDSIRDALVRQLYNPVRWTESMRYLVQQGVGRWTGGTALRREQLDHDWPGLLGLRHKRLSQQKSCRDHPR